MQTIRRAILSHFSRFVLDQILSGEATEIVVERIHEYLTLIGENVRAGKIQLDEFIIFKVNHTSLSLAIVQPRNLIYTASG